MRTQRNWKYHFLPKALSAFPQRIQKDLQTIPMPEFPAPFSSTFIYGGVQTGKTVLACQMALNYAEKAYLQAKPKPKIVFITFSEMLEKIRRSYDQKWDLQDKEENVLQTYLFADILILDDLAASKVTEWVLDMLYMIIDFRYNNEKATIITSNFSLEEIEVQLSDQRITSRINRWCTLIKKLPYKK